MNKQVISVEIVVEAPTWPQGWKKVSDLLALAQEEKLIFHYTIKNGDESL